MSTTSRLRLFSHPQVGASWEGWIIEQIVTFLNNQGISHEGPFYLKTSDGNELDLILILSGKVWGIEIKLTAAPSPQDYTKLKKTGNLIKADKMALISKTERPAVNKHAMSANLETFLTHLS